MITNEPRTSAALLVCGVVRSGHPVLLGAPAPADAIANVRFVRAGALAAVVCDLPGDAISCEDDARRYLGTLIALLPGGPVLPIRSLSRPVNPRPGPQ